MPDKFLNVRLYVEADESRVRLATLHLEAILAEFGAPKQVHIATYWKIEAYTEIDYDVFRSAGKRLTAAAVARRLGQGWQCAYPSLIWNHGEGKRLQFADARWVMLEWVRPVFFVP